MRSLLHMSMFQHTVLAAEAQLAEGLALKLRLTWKVEEFLMGLEGTRKLTESYIEGQAKLPLK
jgi:hypothetical protein